jgi:hypothetical protein
LRRARASGLSGHPAGAVHLCNDRDSADDAERDDEERDAAERDDAEQQDVKRCAIGRALDS